MRPGGSRSEGGVAKAEHRGDAAAIDCGHGMSIVPEDLPANMSSLYLLPKRLATDTIPQRTIAC